MAASSAPDAHAALVAALDTFERDHGVDPTTDPAVEEACLVLIDRAGSVFNFTAKDIRRGGPGVARLAACFDPASLDPGGAYYALASFPPETIAPRSGRKGANVRRVLGLLLDADLVDYVAHRRGVQDLDEEASKQIKAEIHALPEDQLRELLAQLETAVQGALFAAGTPAFSRTCTGYGFHAVLALGGADQRAPLAEIKAAHAGTIAALNAAAGFGLFDPSTKDSGSRVARLPGSYNRKGRDRPRLVRLVERAGARVRLGELPKAEQRKRKSGRGTRDGATDGASPPPEGREVSDAQVAGFVAIWAPVYRDPQRHDQCLCLAGWLAAQGYAEASAARLIGALVDACEDEERADRLGAVRTTYERHRRGPGGVRGWSGLVELGVPAEALDALKRLLEGTGTGWAYRETDAGLVLLRPTRHGPVPEALTNFRARIVEDVVEDDGLETRHQYRIEAALDGRARSGTVPAAQFPAMAWPAEILGAGAVVAAGQGLRDHARAAVQVVSGRVPERRRYAHTGWREVDGSPAYLSASGAVGPDGLATDVDVALPGSLAQYALPAPPDGEDLAAAVRAALRFLDLAPDRLTVPLFGAVWRAPLGEADFWLHLAGRTGTGKTEVAARAQQFYGPGMDARHLPGSWSSTANALEYLAFVAKDALFVVDDFVPLGSVHDQQRLHRDADRVLRGQGNRAGRARLRADATLRETKVARGLILSTGEDAPRGHSLRARGQVLEVGPSDVAWARLSEAQHDGATGRYAAAMSGFLRWLAARRGAVLAAMPDDLAALRQRATAAGAHRRTPAIVADLMLGLRHFLAFAVDVRAVGEAEAAELRERAWAALGEAAREQGEHQAGGDPAERFLALLRAALASREARLDRAKKDGDRKSGNAFGRPPGDDLTIDLGKGAVVGWLDGVDVYLEPEASFAAAQDLGRRTGEPLAVGSRTLRKRLREGGHLASTGGDEGRETLLVRRVIDGQRRQVLHLRTATVLGDGDTEADER